MASEVYFGSEASKFGFDAKVTYEAALEWFESAELLGARKKYKLALLRGAIARGHLGWKLIPHPEVGAFWKAYGRLAEQIAPQLVMPIPKAEIPADSHFIRFRPAIFPPTVSLWHKVGYGHVDLQFAGMGDKLTDMEQLYRQFLLPIMRIERASKSAVIRIRIDPLDITTATFPTCEASIRKGIETAAVLLDWYGTLRSTGDAHAT